MILAYDSVVSVLYQCFRFFYKPIFYAGVQTVEVVEAVDDTHDL